MSVPSISYDFYIICFVFFSLAHNLCLWTMFKFSMSNPIEFDSVQSNSIQFNFIQSIPVQYIMVQFNSIRYNSILTYTTDVTVYTSNRNDRCQQLNNAYRRGHNNTDRWARKLSLISFQPALMCRFICPFCSFLSCHKCAL